MVCKLANSRDNVSTANGQQAKNLMFHVTLSEFTKEDMYIEKGKHSSMKHIAGTSGVAFSE